MSETKTDMMLNGICMVCENKDTLCAHIGQVKEECPFIQKAISTKITNADTIRSMTDEELAEFIDSGCPDCARICPDFKAGCSWTCSHNQGKDFLLKWLQSEAE